MLRQQQQFPLSGTFSGAAPGFGTSQYALRGFGQPAAPRTVPDYETLHAKEAIASGVYVTFANVAANSECIRVGSYSMCFCGHPFASHDQREWRRSKTIPCRRCICRTYKYMFRSPEELGLWWLPKRKDFNANTWRATCKCKHSHELHHPVTLKCKMKCGCPTFESEYPCLVCDKGWERHEVLVETRDERLAAGKSVDESYMPKSATIASPLTEADDPALGLLTPIVATEEIKSTPQSYGYAPFPPAPPADPNAALFMIPPRERPDLNEIAQMRRASEPAAKHILAREERAMVEKGKKMGETALSGWIMSKTLMASAGKTVSSSGKKSKHYF